MEIIKKDEHRGQGIKFFLEENGQEVGRVFFYLLYNDLHVAPFGFLEDLYVAEPYRGQGLGGKLIEQAVAEAKAAGCYKLICTSRAGREELHAWYKKLGFADHGIEFRIDFSGTIQS